MSSNLDVYNAFYETAWASPPASLFAANEKYLSDDFHSLDLAGNVQMDKDSYIGFIRLMFASFPDFKTVIHDTSEQGDSVIVRSHFEGTHNGDFDLSAMGIGVIPASGRRIVWPEATTEWKIAGEQITSIQAKDDSGGLGPFLAALGVTPPAA